MGKYLGEQSILFSLSEMIGSVPVKIRQNGIGGANLRSRGYVRKGK